MLNLPPLAMSYRSQCVPNKILKEHLCESLTIFLVGGYTASGSEEQQM